jgi:hypothetical protein
LFVKIKLALLKESAIVLLPAFPLKKIEFELFEQFLELMLITPRLIKKLF